MNFIFKEKKININLFTHNTIYIFNEKITLHVIQLFKIYETQLLLYEQLYVLKPIFVEIINYYMELNPFQFQCALVHATNIARTETF